MKNLTKGTSMTDWTDKEIDSIMCGSPAEALSYKGPVEALDKEREKVTALIEQLMGSKAKGVSKAIDFLETYRRILFLRSLRLREGTEAAPRKIYTVKDLSNRYVVSLQAMTGWLRRYEKRINATRPEKPLLYKEGRAWVVTEEALPIIDHLHK